MAFILKAKISTRLFLRLQLFLCRVDLLQRTLFYTVTYLEFLSYKRVTQLSLPNKKVRLPSINLLSRYLYLNIAFLLTNVNQPIIWSLLEEKQSNFAGNISLSRVCNDVVTSPSA